MHADSARRCLVVRTFLFLFLFRALSRHVYTYIYWGRILRALKLRCRVFSRKTSKHARKNTSTHANTHTRHQRTLADMSIGIEKRKEKKCALRDNAARYLRVRARPVLVSCEESQRVEISLSRSLTPSPLVTCTCICPAHHLSGE